MSYARLTNTTPFMKKHSILYTEVPFAKNSKCRHVERQNFSSVTLLSQVNFFVCLCKGKWLDGNLPRHWICCLLLQVDFQVSRFFGTNVCINYDVRTSAIDWQSLILCSKWTDWLSPEGNKLDGNLWLWLCVAYTSSTTGDDFVCVVCAWVWVSHWTVCMPASFRHTINIWLNGRHWTHDRFTIQDLTSPTPSLLYRIKSIKRKVV